MTAPAETNGAVVARRPMATPPPAPVPQATPGPPRPGALYVCVTEQRGQRAQSAIAFAPKVDALCRRHPEMRPCQYERDVCRRSGGRVYAANGQEITRRVENEYDRKVLRVRFRAN